MPVRMPGVSTFRAVALAVGWGVAGAGAADLPPVPAPEPAQSGRLIDLAGTGGGGAWKPMEGTAPASGVTVGDAPVIRMPCRFAAGRPDRASWDCEIALDLTACQGLRFLFYSPDPSPVSFFTLYLHSGQGWYAAPFGPTRKGAWSTVTIDKSDMATEQQPGGWGTIDTLRISAWRGAEVDTEFYIANLGLLGADAPIVIIRGDSVAARSADEARSVATQSKGMAQVLDELGLPYVILSDRDVTAGRLTGKRLAILPHNPQMPGAVGDTLAGFLKGGGKMMSFYMPLPPRLGEAAGIRIGDYVRESRRGQFASIMATGHGLPGEPPAVQQASWNLHHAEPVEGRSRVAAAWFDDKGQPTGEPAILVSDCAVHMTHVLLPDDPPGKRGLVLSMLAHLVPPLCEQAASNRVARIGRFGAFVGRADAAAAILAQSAHDSSVRASVEQAARLAAEAGRLASAHRYAEALSAADRANECLVSGYCASREPAAGEHRAWWCHSAFGPAGMDWDAAIRCLATNGFTAILPNMCWGGTAYYASRVLPVAPEVKEQGDQIAKCLAACRKYGVQCHVWKVNWNMDDRAPADFAARMKREGRTQVLFDGRAEDRWLCPSNPDNQQLEIDAMVEIATRYHVDGIHFDYIRYPGPDACFCRACRDRFERAMGARVAHWPADTRRDETVRRQWLDFRRANITRVVAATAERVHATRPGVKISAAVFPNWAVDRDQVGQDWKAWCEKGYLDFVCPMDYTPSPVEFENRVSQQRGWAGKVPCYPGIGLSVWDPKSDVVKLLDDIQVTRRLNTQGFTVFEYDADGAARVAPLCGLGITRRRPAAGRAAE